VIAAGGQTVDEPYIYVMIEAGVTQRQTSFGPVRGPEGHLWVVGATAANDSLPRAEGNGPVPLANVIGKAWFSVYPFGQLGAMLGTICGRSVRSLRDRRTTDDGSAAGQRQPGPREGRPLPHHPGKGGADAAVDHLHREYGGLDCDYSFINLIAVPHGHPWSYPAVYDLVRRLRRATGIVFEPHQYRHTAGDLGQYPCWGSL
jgi:hypothetical protein